MEARHMNSALRIRPHYRGNAFMGFVSWLPKSNEWTAIPTDYKSLVLMNRRAMTDADARPIERNAK